MSNIYLISSPNFANKSSSPTVKFIIEKGFACQFQKEEMAESDSTLSSPEDPNQEPQIAAWYFQANSSHPAGQFWLKVSVLSPSPDAWSWVVQVGNVAAEKFDDWIPTRAMGHEVVMTAIFENYDPKLLDSSPGYMGLHHELRLWLARGWHWMGVGLVPTLQVCNLTLSPTEATQWTQDLKNDMKALHALP